MKKFFFSLIFFLIYFPITSSFLCVHHFQTQYKRIGNISNNSLHFMGEFLNITIIVSIVVVLATVLLLIVKTIFSIKRIILPNHLMLHVSVVIALWCLFIGYDSAFSLFFD